jgi:hypothetical protein
VLLDKNKKHAERTITHLCGEMERKHIMAETDYRFQNYTAQKLKNNYFEGTETNSCSNSSNLLMRRKEYMLQKLKKKSQYNI